MGAVRLLFAGLGTSVAVTRCLELSKPYRRKAKPATGSTCPHGLSGAGLTWLNQPPAFVNRRRKRRNFGKGGGHDRLHRGMGAYAVRQARRRDRRKPDRAGCDRRARRRRHRARRCGRDRARPFQRRASRRRISPPRWCCRPRRTCASSARRAWRTPARPVRRPCIRASRDRGQGGAHRAGGRRRADDHDARARRSARTC